MNEITNASNVTKLNDGKARLQVAKYWQEIFKAPLNIKGDTKLLDNVQTLIDIYSLDQIRQVFIKAKNIFAGDKWQIKNLTPSYILEPKHFADILGRYTPDNHIDLNTNNGLPTYTEKIKDLPHWQLEYICGCLCDLPQGCDIARASDTDLKNWIFRYYHQTFKDIRKDEDGDWIIDGLGVYQ